MRDVGSDGAEGEGDGVVVVSHCVVLVTAVCLLCAGFSLISYDHRYSTEQHCPATQTLRTAARHDTVFYYHTKSHLSVLCEHEDSMWRFFTDLWVRGVVTQTDSWYLLFVQFKSACVGTALVLVAIPFFCVFTSCVCCAVRFGESFLPANRVFTGCEKGFIILLDVASLPYKVLTLISRYSVLSLALRGGSFKSDGLGIMEDIALTFQISSEKYYKRKLRRRNWWELSRYYSENKRELENLVLTAVSSVLLLRFVFLWLGAGASVHSAVLWLEDEGFDYLNLCGHLESQKRLLSVAVEHDLGLSRVLNSLGNMVLSKKVSPPFVLFVCFVACVVADMGSLFSAVSSGSYKERLLRATYQRASDILDANKTRKAKKRARSDARRQKREAEARIEPEPLEMTAAQQEDFRKMQAALLSTGVVEQPTVEAKTEEEEEAAKDKEEEEEEDQRIMSEDYDSSSTTTFSDAEWEDISEAVRRKWG